MSYPDNLQFPDTASRILFDLGYSYALLERAKGLLSYLMAEVSMCEAEEIRQLVSEINFMQDRRMQYRDEVYSAAYAAAKKLDSQ